MAVSSPDITFSATSTWAIVMRGKTCVGVNARLIALAGRIEPVLASLATHTPPSNTQHSPHFSLHNPRKLPPHPQHTHNTSLYAPPLLFDSHSTDLTSNRFISYHHHTKKVQVMHHCLHVTEIVDLIAQCSESFSPGSPHGRCSSVALSQTCKAFYEPALNIHWRTLETLKPLMACFPDDVCAPDEKGNYVSSTYREGAPCF